MKNTNATKSPVMTFMCSVLGHKYSVTTKITKHISEYKCSCCGKEVADTYKGFLIDLTSEQKQVNKILFTYVQRRRNRLIKQLSI
jgi:DNA-directed RNA polymerase subunit RPC12/RpoP